MCWSLWCTLCLLLPLHYRTSCAKEESWSINPISIPGLTCDSLGFHYTVYLNGHLSARLTAFDKQGGAHVLSNLRGCGTWINRLPSGSVVLHAFYHGCYIYEENDETVISISVEKEYNPGNWTLPQMKVLRCSQLGEERTIDEAASNKTVLVSSQGPEYVPSAEESEASGKGCPALNGPLDKEWARIALVVGVLAALLVGINVMKRRNKNQNDK